MTQKQIERRSLIVSTIVNFIMAIAGIVVFALTNMKSMFLDGFFSLIAAISTILAIIFSKLSKKNSATYPTGKYFLEPFYAILKSLLMFALLIFSTVESGISALDYFNKGVGETINFTLVLPYSLVMVGMGLGLHFYNKHQNRKINNSSIMVMAEAKSNLIDGLISLGVCVLIFVLMMIDVNGSLGFLHYTGDFFITLLLVVVCIKEPISLFFAAIREISGATVKDKEIKKLVRDIVRTQLQEEDLDNKFEVYKIGMHIKIVILLNENFDVAVFSRLKKETLKEVKEFFDSVTIEYVIRKRF